jgi:type I restriction enzyme M protein
MQLALKQAISNYIKEHDPKGDVVSSFSVEKDWSAGEVKYNWDHLGKIRECGKWSDDVTGGAEELVRAYLLVRLATELAYPLNKSMILEEPYSIGHPSKKDARLDVKIEDRRDPKSPKSFLLIECKAPEVYEAERTNALKNQLFAIAAQEHTAKGLPVSYLGYYTVRLSNGQIREELEIIDYDQYQNWESWDSANQPIASKSIPARYGVAIKHVYVNKSLEALKAGEEALDNTKDKDFFQRLQRDLHNKLWGGSTEYNYIFKNLSRLFLAKIFDEFTTKPGKPYQFQVQQHVDPKTKKAVNESPQQLFDRIKSVVKDSTKLLGYGHHSTRREIQSPT